jgi:hypothetical protein
MRVWLRSFPSGLTPPSYTISTLRVFLEGLSFCFRWFRQGLVAQYVSELITSPPLRVDKAW